MRSRCAAGGSIVVLWLLALAPPPVAVPKRHSPVAANPRVVLPGTVSSAVAHSQRHGEVPPDEQISVAVNLRLRDTDGLDRLLTALSTPGSAEFGRYLTPAEFLERYGPTESDVTRVRSYLTAQGLSVSVSGNRQVVRASGTSEQLSRAFGTHQSLYVDTNQADRPFYSNDDLASVPAELADVIQGVVGLDNHNLRTTRVGPTRPLTAKGPQSTRLLGGLGPDRYRGAYRLGGLGADGSGVTVALWEFDGYKSENLRAYDAEFGLSGPPVTTVPVDGANYDGSPGAEQSEVELDSEVIRGVAPKATQLVYEAPNTTAGEIELAHKIVADDLASVISISWSSCEQDTTASAMTAVDNAFKQAAAQGMSVFSASGDDGSRDCSRSISGPSVHAVGFPASSPHQTAVGGTRLNASGSGRYLGEEAWERSGGGVSNQFARPGWQSEALTHETMRTVPDVSANADPETGFAIYTAGGWAIVGGTSASAPVWAGFAALFNQRASARALPHLGEASPKLYRMAECRHCRGLFHDIVMGANQDFAARPGYDLVTGWGTPIADNLADALLEAEGSPTGQGG